LDNAGAVGEPPAHLLQQLVACDPEGVCDAAAAAGNIAGKLLALRPDGVKVYGARIAVERLCDRGQLDRLGAALDFLGRQLGQEAPQPIALEIDGGPAFGLVDDVHASFSADSQYSAKREPAIGAVSVRRHFARRVKKPVGRKRLAARLE